MGVYVERWLNEYTNDPPSCSKVYSDVAEYVSAKEGIDVERVRVMYFYGQMPNYREGPVPLKDLPNSDELAIESICYVDAHPTNGDQYGEYSWKRGEFCKAFLSF